MPGIMLVTGAAGFLGSTIVRMARAAGWHVRAFDRNALAEIDGVERFIGDLGNAALLRAASRDAAAIVHAAGAAHGTGRTTRDAACLHAAHVDATRALVEAALECGSPRLVLLSSVAVYGDHGGTLCNETTPCAPRGSYARSKWQAERVAMECMENGQGTLSILRLATAYGEGDRGNVARLIAALDRGAWAALGAGQNRKSLIYKEDAARACLRAAESAAPGAGIFNVAAPPAPMHEIVSTICRALGRPAPRHALPLHWVQSAARICRGLGDPFQLGTQLEKFVHDDAYDGSKFEAAFSFRPAVSLAEGMAREVRSYRSLRSGHRSAQP